MATINKLYVDTANEKLIIKATSSGAEDSSALYKFTKISIDTTLTFNCSESPSSNATEIKLDLDYNEDIDMEIYFLDIYSEDVPNDLIFVWLDEVKYTAIETSGFVNDETAPNYGRMLTVNNNAVWAVFVMNDNVVPDNSAALSIAGLKDTNNTNLININEYLNGTYPNGQINNDFVVESIRKANGLYVKVTYNNTTTYYKMTYHDDYTGATSLRYRLNIIESSEYPTKSTDIEMMPSTFGVTLSVNTLYNNILDKIDIKDETCCQVDCSDVNYMLAWNGFNLSKSLKQYKQMIYYWNILHKGNLATSTSCNCNK